MLSSSLRRAAWAPVAPVAGICRSSTQGLATSSAGIVRQRRYSSSSSKPSDGSRKVDASSQAPAKDVSSAGEKQGKSPRRRGKDGSGSGRNGSRSNQPNAFSNLPSVPSTQHLQPHDVQLASFFSIHRPISVSTTVPPPSTPEAFGSIFTKQPSKTSSDDVIFTLSSAVNSMEHAAHHLAENDGIMNAFEMESNQLDGLDMTELKMKPRATPLSLQFKSPLSPTAARPTKLTPLRSSKPGPWRLLALRGLMPSSTFLRTPRPPTLSACATLEPCRRSAHDDDVSAR
ncbi:hypothetical protein BDW60DRAFT_140608 [Aspergillus nidulans var. acristatus]